jgi:molybdate transport system substrate-binding protein
VRRVLAVSVLAALAACSNSSSAGTSGGSTTQLTVFAASSLTDAFTQIGQDFHAANPGVTVTFDFGSSTDLAAQIQTEGIADVFASASEVAMDTVQSDPGAAGRMDFASNRLVIITPPDDPAAIGSLQDLTKSGVQLILAAEGVPVGDYARDVLDNAGILEQALPNVVSNEEDDAGVVGKITTGEADAGIVYTSDVAAAGDSVRAVEIPNDVNVVASYPIAVVTGSADPDQAKAFLDHVLSPAGRATLERFGFGPPKG